MSNQEILENLKEIIDNVVNVVEELIDIKKLSEKTVIDSLNIDELDKQEFIFEIERKYDISISDEQFDNCETFEELIYLIKNKL